MDQDDTWYGASLGLRDTVLDEDPAPPPLKGHSPQFSANVRCGQTAGWIKMSLGMEVCFGPGHIVLDGDPAPPPKKGTQPPNFGPCLLCRPNGWMDQDATWYEGGLGQAALCYMGTQLLLPKGAEPPPQFWPVSILAKWSPISGSAEHLLRRVSVQWDIQTR